MLFIQDVQKLSEQDLQNVGLPGQIQNSARIRHWRLAFGAYSKGEPGHLVELKYVRNDYHGYTMSNASHWEIKQIKEWFREKNKTNTNLKYHLSKKIIFRDVDLFNWSNTCYLSWLSKSAKKELIDFLDSLPATNVLVRFRLQPLSVDQINEIQPFLIKYIKNNFRIFTNQSFSMILVMFSELADAEKFIQHYHLGNWYTSRIDPNYIPQANLTTEGFDRVSHPVSESKNILKWMRANIRNKWTSFEGREKWFANEEDAFYFRMVWAGTESD